MRVVCISDTHRQHFDLVVPPGDILIHAGDATGMGEHKALRKFGIWMRSQPHRHKIFVAGNHDLSLEKNPALAAHLFEGIHYLYETGVEIEGLKFWGSPYSPRFLDWAYQCERGDDCRARWAKIPDNTDVLIVHGPPFGYGDACPDFNDPTQTVHVGCAELLERIERIRPKLTVHGHIHEGYGSYETPKGVRIVNAASVDGRYRLVNPPIIVDL